MNLYSVAIDALRRFAARHRTPRAVKQKTYVFVLVPSNVGENGRAKRAEIAQNLIDNGSGSHGARDDALSTLTAADSESQLNYDLMWTWLLPNPLWPPKK
jgi:hypothetical protein